MPTNRKPFDDEDEEDSNLDKCRSCIHFEASPNEDVSYESIAACLHPDLEEYELKVSGDSSCNLFEPADEEDDEDADDEIEDEDEEY